MDINPAVLVLAVFAIGLVVLVLRSNTRSKDRPKTGQPGVVSTAPYRADFDIETRQRRDLQTRSQSARRMDTTQREDERRREEDRRRANDDVILTTDPRHPLYHTLTAPVDTDRSCDTDHGHKHQAPYCAPDSSHRSDSHAYGGSSDSYGGSSRSDSYGGSSYGGSDSSSSSSSSSSDSGGGGGGGGGGD